jgi:hypothetical protein
VQPIHTSAPCPPPQHSSYERGTALHGVRWGWDHIEYKFRTRLRADIQRSQEAKRGVSEEESGSESTAKRRRHRPRRLERCRCPARHQRTSHRRRRRRFHRGRLLLSPSPTTTGCRSRRRPAHPAAAHGPPNELLQQRRLRHRPWYRCQLLCRRTQSDREPPAATRLIRRRPQPPRLRLARTPRGLRRPAASALASASSEATPPFRNLRRRAPATLCPCASLPCRRRRSRRLSEGHTGVVVQSSPLGHRHPRP